MATNRVLQLLRSNQVYASLTAAKNAILTGGENSRPMVGADGEIRIARYNAGTVETPNVKSLLCVYHASPSLPNGTAAGWTFIEDAQSGSDGIAALQAEVDHLEAQVGQDGASDTFVSGAASDSDAEKVLTGAQDNTGSAPDDLTEAVLNVATYIGTLDKSASATDGKVLTTVSQVNGQVDETQADLTDIKMGGYSKTNDTGAIAATDTLEVAVSKLENGLAANAVHSNDHSINVAADATNGGTNIEVNVDGTTIAKDSTSHALKSVVKIVKQTSNLDSNVREQYVLADSTGAALTGDVIKIYKDSALYSVYLGHVDDALTNADAQGESADTAVTNGTGSEALCFIYHLENDKYKLETVNVESFLQESEFGNGLDVDSTNHTVSVKAYDGITVDANGVSVTTGNGLELTGTSPNKAVAVKIDSTNDTNKYLSVSANGVALNGDAIDDAIENAATTLTEVAAKSPAETTADGTDFIKVVATTESDGHTNYDVSTQGIKDAIAVETARAESAETAIDSAVGLTKAQNGETRSYTSQVTLGTSETAPTTVAGDIDLLDAHVEALDAAAVKSVTVASGEHAISVDNTDAQNPVLSFNLSEQQASTSADAQYAGGNSTSNILQVKNDGLYLDNVWDCGTY